MTESDRVKVLFGPYRTPKVRVGTVLADEARDKEVIVVGFTDAPIPWPVGKTKGGWAKSLVVFGVLADAVRTESNLAVCHWWGITPQTVTKWRKALGVGQYTKGTLRLKVDYSQEPQFVAARAKAHARLGDPDRRAKIAAAMTGKSRPWSVVRGMIERQTGKIPSEETRRRMSEAHKKRGTRPPKAGRPWTAEEDELLRTLPPWKVVPATGRSLSAVYSRRRELRLPDARGRS